MKYKSVFLGAIFGIIVMAVEDNFNLKKFTLLIPVIVIIALFAFIQSKLKNQRK